MSLIEYVKEVAINEFVMMNVINESVKELVINGICKGGCH